MAASLSAPTLFTIAEDLSKMQILTNVDEGDIGQIKEGQDVVFTVQAYPDKKFSGKVVQIRLGSTVISNVVNYIVVVNAENDNGLLLPEMTATVDFYVEKRNDVLIIPNAALRFQPTEEMKTAYAARVQKERENLPDSIKRRFQSMEAPKTHRIEEVDLEILTINLEALSGILMKKEIQQWALCNWALVMGKIQKY